MSRDEKQSTHMRAEKETEKLSQRNREMIDLTHQFRWASQVALVVKNPPANPGDAKDVGPIPRLGRYPRVGNDNPLQYSCYG